MSAAKIQQQAKFFFFFFFKKLQKNIPRAANDNFPGREPQLLSILSVSRLPVRSSFSLSVISCTRLWYTHHQSVPEVLTYVDVSHARQSSNSDLALYLLSRNIQVFIYSTRTRRYLAFHQKEVINIIYIIIYIILI